MAQTSLNNNSTKPIILGLVGTIIVLALWLLNSYNGLVDLSAQVDTQWAQVETQYQRRFDLIPNLVEATKGTMAQEQEIFTAIAQARTQYGNAVTVEDKVEVTTQLESSLGRLLVIMENYPTLQSNTTVLSLMDELAGTENRISVERNRYNDTVKTYNVRIKTIPTVFVSGLFGYTDKPLFTAVAEASQAPQVDLTE